LIDLVNVTLVEVVVHCDRGTSGGGPATDGRDIGDSVDSQMVAEKDDGLAVMPHQTAQLPTLPRPHLTLRQSTLDIGDVGR
jgi:hypothetical protein